MVTVGYARSFENGVGSCEVQKSMIRRYCKTHNIDCDRFYCDPYGVKRNSDSVKNMQTLGYKRAYRLESTFPQWEQMLQEICDGKIDTILVDMYCRLYISKALYEFFENMCNLQNVKIIEVSGYFESQRKEGEKSIAIYHFTNKSEDRPRIYEKEIDRLYDFVSQQECWGTPTLYLDFSLKKSEHSSYDKFRQYASEYDVLLVTDFFHVEDKLGTFLKEVSMLQVLGVTVESLKEGVIQWLSNEASNENLTVAIYDRWLDDSDRELEIDRIKAFVKYKTVWNIESVYIEENKVENDAKQKELQCMIQNADKYDMVLVRKFNCFHWRTSMFFKIVRKLEIPIYSMKEGGVYLEKSRD